MSHSQISKPIPHEKGLLISFDGLDSSGKATQTRRLVERLRYSGFKVQEFRSPDYNTPSGQELKRRLQNEDGTWQATPWQEKMKLFSQNRLEHRDEVKAALEQGIMVVYDRYVPSSITFMAVEAMAGKSSGTVREEIWQAVEKEEFEVHDMPHDDVSIFLDVPPKVSGALLDRRKNENNDKHEYTDHQHIQEQLYNEYDLLMHHQPERFFRVPCVEGVELLGIDDIAELVWDGLVAKFPLLKHRSVD